MPRVVWLSVVSDWLGFPASPVLRASRLTVPPKLAGSPDAQVDRAPKFASSPDAQVFRAPPVVRILVFLALRFSGCQGWASVDGWHGYWVALNCSDARMSGSRVSRQSGNAEIPGRLVGQ